MPRIKSAPSAVVPARKAVHYHMILRPVLQRRFARSSLWTFVVCCIVSFLIGERYAFSLLMPWSVTFARAIVLFTTVFPVLIIRKADLHVHFNPRLTLFSVLAKEIFAPSTVQSITAYFASALSLTCLYVRNVNVNTKLTITITRGYELPRLNERLVYLIFFAMFTSTVYGILQKAVHRTLLPYRSVSTHLRTELLQEVSKRLIVAALFALSSAVLGPLFYIPLRPMIWTYSLRFARIFVKMPRSPNLPDFPVGLDLLCRSIFVSFLTATLWESANLFFDAFISKLPASKGELLSEKSDDPNGTLITGLQNREKPFTQATAFEELALIANNHKERRQTIYSGHGNGTSVWLQILRAALEVLADVKNKHQGPQQSGSKGNVAETTRPLQPEESQPLPVKQANIFASKGPQKLPFDFVRSHETSASNPPGAVSAASPGRWWSRLDAMLSNSQSFPVSWPFRPCIELQSTCDLQHVRLVVQAVQGISQLVVHSAGEDNLGLVQWDLGVLLNCLYSTLKTLETYMRTFQGRQIHTPQAFLQQRHLLAEQDVLVKAIRLAISDIVSVFGRYLDQTGLDSDTADFCQRIWDREL